MVEKIRELTEFLENSLTAYHAKEQARQTLLKNGFTALSETEDFELVEGGKYFVERGASLIAFTVGGLDRFSYKIVASHVDSPALKLKENPVKRTENCAVLNVEPYGGGVWYSFFDRPLKIAGRVVKNDDGRIYAETVESPFLVTVPSLAVHQNRGVNEGFAVNAQTDLLPLLSLAGGESEWLEKLAGETRVLSHDLFIVNAEKPYTFGVNNEFLASPRIDNLTSVCGSLEALLGKAESDGVCVAALMHHEEVGSHSTQGAGGDFLENVLRRIAYALRFDDNEFYKALASSFFLSVDNAHALHPNHPEKSDPTNKTLLGGGVVIKSHAGGAYVTDAVSSAIVKTVLEKAGVSYQSFFNRSDARSGSTLGVAALTRLGIAGADIGLAQLAMHSACECFAASDYIELVNGLTAFYSSDFIADSNGFTVR
ncbi:MAG: M18 family aminopeptidase [Clostridia bacterium]|nr:M18 family aminopeptidase [Clostridia bacterium]